MENGSEDGVPAEVRFVSWNLQNYLHTAAPPAEVLPGATKPKAAASVAAVTRILKTLRPDIAGFCEMGSPEDLAALQERLKSEGLELPYREFLHAADTSRALALLSRFPIVERQSQARLTYLLDEAKLPVQRGFLDVTVQIGDTYRLRVLGAHLKSRRDVPEADESLMRRNEAHLLRQHADAILTNAPETNLLVYGDFNGTRDEPALKAVGGMRGTPRFLTALTPSDTAGQRWTYYFPAADTYSRVDFVFASKGLNPEVSSGRGCLYAGADWNRASDHRALTTMIIPQERTRKARKAAKPITREEDPPAAEETEAEPGMDPEPLGE